jgi:hypothetical protein
MLRSSFNDLLIGTLDGLVRIRDEKLTVFTKTDGLSGNTITPLLEDANHTLWIVGYEFPAYPVPDGQTMDSFLRSRVDEGIRVLLIQTLASGSTVTL